ncbi:hypothetical protein [Okeania sp.]|uniref:hypothetical protein n=1 Tax=Okeania sp. TaxID=3100323 RepID=UPI002B4B6577|nr:hypothetical protein [Okeania sp.]MEB3342616.1 hypothetical protein [Okeania sp.]
MISVFNIGCFGIGDIVTAFALLFFLGSVSYQLSAIIDGLVEVKIALIKVGWVERSVSGASRRETQQQLDVWS